MTKLPKWRWVVFFGLLFGLPLLLLVVDASPDALDKPGCQTPQCNMLATLALGVLAVVSGLVLHSAAKPVTWRRRIVNGGDIEFPALLRTDPAARSAAASALQLRLRETLYPAVYQRIVHDGADGLVLQDLKGAAARSGHLFLLCHFHLQHDSPLFMGCLRTYLGQVAPSRPVHLVVCGAMEEMGQSMDQWQASRFTKAVAVPFVAVQLVDPESGETRLDGSPSAVAAQVTAAVAEVARAAASSV